MDSELNPEAPEFHPLPDPEVVTTIEEGLKRMNQATRISNTFPIGASYNLFKTYTDFNVVVSKLRKNILNLSSEIMVVELPSVKLQCDNNESNSEIVVDANDHLLDRININIDTSSGVNRAPAMVVRTAQPAAWNRTPLVTTVKTTSGGSASLFGAKNIARPQLSFTEPVDNSNELFKPRIRDKPNAIEPLSLTMLYDETGCPTGYEHPYKPELRMYSPPQWALEANDELAFPPPLESVPVTFVDSPRQLADLVDHLASVTEIAVDLEHHSYRTYQGITCLMQISTDDGGDFIVDALALRDHLHALNHAFTDPNKVKVFHGADRDVQWLQRDFGVYLVGLFDTHQAARLLRLDGLALRHLLHQYCGLSVDKTFQLADWRIRPLPDELVKYARIDTHYLLYVWRRMRRALLERDPALLRTAFAKSAQVALTTYAKPRLTADAHMALYARSGARFTRAQLTALGAAWAWRDKHARELDESPAYLVPDRILLAAAEALPRDVQGLRALAQPVPPFLNQNIDALHRIILASREIPEEPQVLSMPASMLAMLAPPPRDPLHSAHDLHAAPPPEESEWEPAAVGAAPPDVSTFLSPPATPPRSKSQLNAEAQTFVPPYERYKMYRVVSQVEEVKALRDKEARVAALSRDSDVIRHEVLPKLQTRDSAADREEPDEGPPIYRPPPATADCKQRKRKRQDKLDRTNATRTIDDDASNKHTRNKNDIKPYDYKNANYEKFLKEDGKRKKQPKIKQSPPA